MYNKIEKWLDSILGQEIPSGVVAFCFNLYEDEDYNWSMELVGTGTFDLEDEDWACDEVTDFGTRDDPFSWEKETSWDKVLDEIISILKKYLETGIYASVLKSCKGVGAGFTDGSIEILYSR